MVVLIRQLATAAALAMFAGAGAPAQSAGRPAQSAGPATTTLTPIDQALARAFPGARIEPHTLALSPADVKAVEKRARARCEARLVTAYVAWRGDTLAGAAYTDRRVVRTREALLMTTIAPDTTVARIDVLAFFEPPDYRPSERWLARFKGGRPGAALTPGRDVPPLAGASLTSRAVSESARIALAWHALLLAPELAKRKSPPATPEAHKTAGSEP